MAGKRPKVGRLPFVKNSRTHHILLLAASRANAEQAMTIADVKSVLNPASRKSTDHDALRHLVNCKLLDRVSPDQWVITLGGRAALYDCANRKTYERKY